MPVRNEAGLLPRMEPFAGELIADGLREAGVDVHIGASVDSAMRDASGEVRTTVSDGREVASDEILFAIGRTPRTADLGLETIGLTPGDWLPVDGICRVTTIPDGWLYAVGDVNHRALMTHQGKYQARMAGAAIGARANSETVDDTRRGEHAAPPTSKLYRKPSSPILRHCPRACARLRTHPTCSSDAPGTPIRWPGSTRRR
ncbi:FAD-dependent oxidoreductase [Streptomyces avermitilis]|uniref:FAD-dependent oxidoreductase n=1 Tax=Streptomyces avermitilis TaxID=33903 RepID=UPI00382E6232